MQVYSLGRREGEEMELEGLADSQGEVGVSDCLSNKFLGMKSPLWFLHTLLPPGGNAFLIFTSSGKSMAT